MHERICRVCEKTFETIHETSERHICYRCALTELCGRFAPEGGDFNSALIISGEMTEKKWKMLQEDLRAVEEGRSIREFEEDEVLPGESIWDNRCYGCDVELLYGEGKYCSDCIQNGHK